MFHGDDWTLQASCRGMKDDLFPEARDQKKAKVICFTCPVRAQCLAEALDNRIEWGVWGGMTERERRQLLRQRPNVKSWAEALGSSDFPIQVHARG
ncbi:MAG: WhiB family transcriptional regulator [Propionibacteriaceae bacterium]|nr:WhiB family transcriptional regulator [Propionibacteriaceae bacterium]